MNIKIRSALAGTEYWDNVEKRTRFVPTGYNPDFEVTKNPTTMIASVDLASGKDMKVVNNRVVDIDTDINLDKMNAEQLREFAKQNNIDLPFNVKKEETIRKNIEDALAAADDE